MKTILEPKTVYMNPPTGSVGYGQEWESNCGNGKGFPISDLYELVAVEPDIDFMIKHNYNLPGIWKETL